MFDLTGRKAIVTGAAGELGFAMAQGLCRQGADVAVLDLAEDAPQRAAQLEGSGTAFAVRADLGDRESAKAAFAEAAARLGGLDILVNCAGVNHRSAAEAFAAEDWDRVLEVNLSATFFLCQLAAAEMIPRKSGKIINVASMNSFVGGFNNAAYAASKGGVGQLTKTLSNEWGRFGIQVNAIAPGYMKTKMNRYYFTTAEGEALQSVIISRIPQGRWGLPDDLAGAAVFLASREADYVSGLVLPVDGGFLGR